jgi:hypothetical protein
MNNPHALRVTFTKELSPTTRAFLLRKPMKGDEELIQEWIETFLAEAQRFALDYVSQWIVEGSVTPTVAVVNVDGEVLDQRVRLNPMRRFLK